MPAKPRLLQLHKAAEYLGLTPRALRKLIHQGGLPIVRFKPRGIWSIDRRDLPKYKAKVGKNGK